MVHRVTKAAAMAAALALALSGCAGHLSRDVARNPTTFQAPDVAGQAAVSSNYRLGALDTVNVAVFQVPDLTGDYQVDPTGDLNLPLVGRVPAQGKTVPELQAHIRQLYGAKYLQNPDVRVEIKQAVSQRLTVEGAVNQPGIYPVSGDMTLVQAVATARGPSGDALVSRVVIFRKINGQRQAAAFDLSKIRRGQMDDPAVYGNDVIVVDGSSVRRSFRDVLSSIPLLGFFNAL